MHSSASHRHGEASEESNKETKGLIGSGGWRYDLTGWFHDTFSFRGTFRAEAEDCQPGPIATRRAGAGCRLRHRNAGDGCSTPRGYAGPRCRR